MSDFYLLCTCKMQHTFVYAGCEPHNVDRVSITVKEIVEIKQDMQELINRVVALEKKVEAME